VLLLLISVFNTCFAKFGAGMMIWQAAKKDF